MLKSIAHFRQCPVHKAANMTLKVFFRFRASPEQYVFAQTA